MQQGCKGEALTLAGTHHGSLSTTSRPVRRWPPKGQEEPEAGTSLWASCLQDLGERVSAAEAPSVAFS